MQAYTFRQRDRIFLYFILILILLTLLVTASYTWFSLSKTPQVSDLDIYVNSPSGLELTADLTSNQWGQQISFKDAGLTDTSLKPCTWSQKEGIFYGAMYGADGRQLDQWQPLSDANNANREGPFGYYTCATVYVRAQDRFHVSLSPAQEVEEGVSGAGTYLVGAPVWNAETISHDPGGSGAEFAMRIGLRIYKVNGYGEPTGETERFVIYEPNSDGHPNGAVGYVSTPSIDGTEHLTDQADMILQTTSTWQESDPVQRDRVQYTLGEFQGETHLFDIEAGEMYRIDIYIWLEGQDVDCTNMIGHEALIFTNIQFLAEQDSQSGIQPIE